MKSPEFFIVYSFSFITYMINVLSEPVTQLEKTKGPGNYFINNFSFFSDCDCTGFVQRCDVIIQGWRTIDARVTS